MYESMAVIAVFALAYSAIAGGVERSWLSGPLVFTIFGLVVGPLGLGLLHLDVENEQIRTLAELTLALVLFTDAADSDFKVLRRASRLPTRLLLVGLPLTILLGYGAGSWIFPEMPWVAVALLATMLAPTDAALGQAVVQNEDVPDDVRQALNVESGLNDGICVPILFVFLALAGDDGSNGGTGQLVVHLVSEAIGIGALTGVVVAGIGVELIRECKKRDWISPTWIQVPVVAMAFASFAIAQSLGGSGFIAAFVGGLFFGWRLGKHRDELLLAAEGAGGVFSLITWVTFGSAVIGRSIDYFDASVLLYSILSLTVIRMLPVFLVTSGLRQSTESKLFLGWFGPRGLASIVFIVIVVGSDIPDSNRLTAVVVSTVVLSILAHGVSATPWASAFGRRSKSAPNRVGESSQ